MKEIKIICVGRIKESYFTDGILHYAGKIRRKYPISIVECPDEPTPDKASPAEEDKIRQVEGERILGKIQNDDYVIALCIDGTSCDTARWRRKLSLLAGQIPGNLVFVIGGSLGLSPSVIRRADERQRFSAMTFPHQMMRMILCEQLAGWTNHI